MVQPRISRRRMIINSSDNEENDNQAKSNSPNRQSSESQKRGDGRLKPTKKSIALVGSSRKDGNSRQPTQKPGGNLMVSSQAASKPAAKPIYSFFNAATQKLQSSQPLAVNERPSLPRDGVETIQDASDDESSSQDQPDVTLSKGSSTALALRKRKFKRTESFENDAAYLAPISQKFRKSSNGDRVQSLSVFNEDKRPWTEQFAPIDLSELAVHKKKVADVRQWIESSLRNRRNRVLVLKGAAGTGKTVTTRLLAQALGIDLLEWKDASASDYGAEGYSSSASRFEEFVGRAATSHSLLLSADPQTYLQPKKPLNYESTDFAVERLRALLIEEFPNTFSRTSTPLKVFRSAVTQYLATPVLSNSPVVPIIMIISETLLSTSTAVADSFTAHRLLGPELMMHPYLNVIEFNPVAPTFLIKALETIVVKEARKSGRRKTPGPQVLKHLAETGDIRSATSSLEFLCLRADDDDTWSSKVTFTKSKSSKAPLPPLTKSEEEALKLITNRESTLGIFHSVGKIVYNKRIDPKPAEAIVHPPAWLPQHRRTRPPETEVNTLIDDLGTDTTTFIAALHENYALSCSSSSSEDALDSLVGSIENISDSDLLSFDRFSFGTRAFTGTSADGLRQDEMCFQVATRGILFSLPSPVHRTLPTDGKRGDAHRMFYPTSLKLWRKKEEIEGKLDVLLSRLSTEGDGATALSRSPYSDRTGVESWRRSSPDTQSPSDKQQSDLRITTEAKVGMVLNHLPFFAQILSASAVSAPARTLADMVTEITRLSGNVPTNDEDDASDEGDDEATANAEQWTTDLPEGKMDNKPKQLPNATSSKAKAAFEGGGLAIPVESCVEKLVLEDDDIIDD